MRLSKKDELQAKCRMLWERFDPIGLNSFSPGIDGEYDGYIPQTVSLLTGAADRHKLSSFVQNSVYVSVGLPRVPSQDEAIRWFVQELSELRDTSRPGKT